jgi:hypothetical protein
VSGGRRAPLIKRRKSDKMIISTEKVDRLSIFLPMMVLTSAQVRDVQQKPFSGPIAVTYSQGKVVSDGERDNTVRDVKYFS